MSFSMFVIVSQVVKVFLVCHGCVRSGIEGRGYCDVHIVFGHGGGCRMAFVC